MYGAAVVAGTWYMCNIFTLYCLYSSPKWSTIYSGSLAYPLVYCIMYYVLVNFNSAEVGSSILVGRSFIPSSVVAESEIESNYKSAIG